MLLALCVGNWWSLSCSGDTETETVDVSSEWWAEYVKGGDQSRMELSGKLTVLFDILRMCEEIGDKMYVVVGDNDLDPPACHLKVHFGCFCLPFTSVS